MRHERKRLFITHRQDQHLRHTIPEGLIELQENYAVLSLPKEAVEINLMVQVYHSGKIITVERTLSLEDIREAFKNAEDDYLHRTTSGA